MSSWNFIKLNYFFYFSGNLWTCQVNQVTTRKPTKTNGITNGNNFVSNYVGIYRQHNSVGDPVAIYWRNNFVGIYQPDRRQPIQFVWKDAMVWWRGVFSDDFTDGMTKGVTPHLTSKILSALGLPVHPNPGLPPRSPSRVCSWQPRMTPKRVFQSSAAHSPCQILSLLGLPVHPFLGFHPGPPQGFKHVLLVKVSMHL